MSATLSTIAPGFSIEIKAAFTQYLRESSNKTRFSDEKHWLYQQLLLFPDAKAPPYNPAGSRMDACQYAQYFRNKARDARTNFEIYNGTFI